MMKEPDYEGVAVATRCTPAASVPSGKGDEDHLSKEQRNGIKKFFKKKKKSFLPESGE